MAYTIQASLADSFGSPELTGRKTVVPTSNEFQHGRKTIKTTEVEIVLQVIPGNIMLLNRGVTDVINIGYATGVYLFDLYPGEPLVVRPSSVQSVTSLFVVASADAEVDNLDFLIRAT